MGISHLCLCIASNLRIATCVYRYTYICTLKFGALLVYSLLVEGSMHGHVSRPPLATWQAHSLYSGISGCSGVLPREWRQKNRTLNNAMEISTTTNWLVGVEISNRFYYVYRSCFWFPRQPKQGN